jgi:hypothetical protein
LSREVRAVALLEHDEDIAAWAKAIALWMQQQKLDRVGFVELLDGVGYPVVKGWLAVLLDEGLAMDRLEGSDFYRSTGILVALKRDEMAESLCVTALQELAIAC